MKSKYIKALKKSILFYAITHLIILFGYAIYTSNLKLLNLFNILDLELVFPNIVNGLISDILSVIALIIIYIIFLI